MKDATSIGVISGFLATLVFTTFQWVLYSAGIMESTLVALWAKIILPNNPLTLSSWVLGFLGHLLAGMFFAVLITYYFKQAGTDYLWLKSLLIGGLLWVFRIILVPNIFAHQGIGFPGPSVVLSELASHMVYGLLVGNLIRILPARQTAVIINKK